MDTAEAGSDLGGGDGNRVAERAVPSEGRPREVGGRVGAGAADAARELGKEVPLSLGLLLPLELPVGLAVFAAARAVEAAGARGPVEVAAAVAAARLMGLLVMGGLAGLAATSMVAVVVAAVGELLAVEVVATAAVEIAGAMLGVATGVAVATTLGTILVMPLGVTATSVSPRQGEDGHWGIGAPPWFGCTCGGARTDAGATSTGRTMGAVLGGPFGGAASVALVSRGVKQIALEEDEGERSGVGGDGAAAASDVSEGKAEEETLGASGPEVEDGRRTDGSGAMARAIAVRECAGGVPAEAVAPSPPPPHAPYDEGVLTSGASRCCCCCKASTMPLGEGRRCEGGVPGGGLGLARGLLRAAEAAVAPAGAVGGPLRVPVLTGRDAAGSGGSEPGVAADVEAAVRGATGWMRLSEGPCRLSGPPCQGTMMI